ncbi:hypothetical protein SUGI_0460890 [Cryptomeria japonica]|nr:hypothetical protein SUGI_0460890 [Cryptomeria japonica]
MENEIAVSTIARWYARYQRMKDDLTFQEYQCISRLAIPVTENVIRIFYEYLNELQEVNTRESFDKYYMRRRKEDSLQFIYVHDKDSDFPEVMMSDIELEECQNMPNQEETNACEHPSIGQNTINNMDTTDEWDSFSCGITGCICCMSQDEEKLKYGQGKELEDFTKDTGFEADELDDCQIIDQY